MSYVTALLTVFPVKLVNLVCVLAILNHIIKGLIIASYCRDFRSWEFGQRIKEQAIDCNNRHIVKKPQNDCQGEVNSRQAFRDGHAVFCEAISYNLVIFSKRAMLS